MRFGCSACFINPPYDFITFLLLLLEEQIWERNKKTFLNEANCCYLFISQLSPDICCHYTVGYFLQPMLVH